MGRAYRFWHSMKEWQRTEDMKEEVKDLVKHLGLVNYRKDMKEFTAKIVSALPAEQVRTRDGSMRTHQKFVVEDVVDMTTRYPDKLVVDSWLPEDQMALQNGVGQIFSLCVKFNVSQSKNGVPFNNIRLVRQSAVSGAGQQPQPQGGYYPTAQQGVQPAPQQYGQQQYQQQGWNGQTQQSQPTWGGPTSQSPQYLQQKVQNQGGAYGGVMVSPQGEPQHGPARTYYAKDIPPEEPPF